jgi:hypothetical protein
MPKLPLIALSSLLAWVSVTPTALAEPEIDVEESASVIVWISDPSDPFPSHAQLERAELERDVTRSRNALIGTSVALAVGTAVLFPVTAHCLQYENQERCGRGAEAAFVASSIVFTSGLVGTIVTGAMFGARKAKLRRLRDSRALSFDPERGALVF